MLPGGENHGHSLPESQMTRSLFAMKLTSIALASLLCTGIAMSKDGWTPSLKLDCAKVTAAGTAGVERPALLPRQQRHGGQHR